jgi:hypothetical protein
VHIEFGDHTCGKVSIRLQACAWISSCENSGREGSCIAHFGQMSANDQAVVTNGQLASDGEVVGRNTEILWGLSCSILAHDVFNLKSENNTGPPDIRLVRDSPDIHLLLILCINHLELRSAYSTSATRQLPADVCQKKHCNFIRSQSAQRAVLSR